MNPIRHRLGAEELLELGAPPKRPRGDRRPFFGRGGILARTSLGQGATPASEGAAGRLEAYFARAWDVLAGVAGACPREAAGTPDRAFSAAAEAVQQAPSLLVLAAAADLAGRAAMASGSVDASAGTVSNILAGLGRLLGSLSAAEREYLRDRAREALVRALPGPAVAGAVDAVPRVPRLGSRPDGATPSAPADSCGADGALDGRTVRPRIRAVQAPPLAG